MKLEKTQARPAAFLLGFFASLGGIGCLVTGMGFDAVSMVTVAVVCAIAAALCALTAGRKYFPLIPAVSVLIGLWLWRTGSLNQSAEAFLSHISRLYDSGYGWGIIRWSTEALSVDMAQDVLYVLGALIALGVSWSFLRCKGIWLTAILTGMPVIPCMVLTDTVPAAPYLFLSLLCLSLLLMIRLARKRRQDIVLLKLLALPAAAAILVLFLFMPQKSYAGLESVDTFLGYIQEFFADSSKEGPQAPVNRESQWVDLTAVGAKSVWRTVVMEVQAQQTGYLYLKGKAYDTYQGTWWECQSTAPVQPQLTGAVFRVRITTKEIHDVLYLPYGAYAVNGSNVLLTSAEKNGRVENPGLWHSYQVQYRQQPPYDDSWQLHSQDAPVLYCQLPEDTLDTAQSYIKRELPELNSIHSVWGRAQHIVSHVSNSAAYSLRTSKMPADYEDFALWFLEESDTGYCIHFATAAAVLLRAAGIPCRYVTGYLVSAQADRTVEVQKNNAHAWVECYIDGVGWVPLEPTPGNGLSETVGRETTPPTEAPTQPQSTEATQTPDNTTEPSQPGETVPSGGEDTLQPATQPWVMPLWLKWGLGLVCAVGAVIGQWRLRVSLRQRKRNRGRSNAQILARWQEVVLHCRVRGIDPDARLHELAQKARFSQHVVTREERRELDDWLRASKAEIRQMGLPQKLLATVVYALF